MTEQIIETPLIDAIINYTHNPKLPFHMPGHAGNCATLAKFIEFLGLNAFKADLTELDELDNLHNPETVIKKTQEKISKIYDSQISFLLVNGSTSGMMSLVMSVAREGEKVLVARNCHRSVISGLILSGVMPVWLRPEWLKDWQIYGAVNPEEVDKSLESDPDIKAVILTSPTYEGVASNIKSIKTIARKFGVPVIVDEAHGGHWQFFDKFPQSALYSGADAVVQSLHKTCGSLSQSSLLHISKKSIVNPRIVEENLKMLQSTSPSYLLMASLDAATSFLAGDEGQCMLENIYKNSTTLTENLSLQKNISVFTGSKTLTKDPTRLFVKIKGLPGEQFANIIQGNYNIAIESFSNAGVLFFLNIGNTKEQIDQLYKAILEISSKIYDFKIPLIDSIALPNQKINPRKAYFSNSFSLEICNAVGKYAAFPVVKYPPGICILVPGELITQQHLQFFNKNEKIFVLDK